MRDTTTIMKICRHKVDDEETILIHLKEKEKKCKDNETMQSLS